MIHSCSCILVIYFYSSLLTRIFLPFLCFLFCRLFHHCCRFVEQSFQTLSFISFFVCRLVNFGCSRSALFYYTNVWRHAKMSVWVVNIFRSDLSPDEPWICIKKRFMLSIWSFTLLSNLRWRFFRSCHESAPNSFKVWRRAKMRVWVVNSCSYSEY